MNEHRHKLCLMFTFAVGFKPPEAPSFTMFVSSPHPTPIPPPPTHPPASAALLAFYAFFLSRF